MVWNIARATSAGSKSTVIGDPALDAKSMGKILQIIAAAELQQQSGHKKDDPDGFDEAVSRLIDEDDVQIAKSKLTDSVKTAMSSIPSGKSIDTTA